MGLELRVRVRVRGKATASAMARPRVRFRVGVRGDGHREEQGRYRGDIGEIGDAHREEVLRGVALLVTVAVALLDRAPGQRHHAQLRPQHLARARG